MGVAEWGGVARDTKENNDKKVLVRALGSNV